MTDVAAIHSPVGCAHCHPHGEVMVKCVEAQKLDYFWAAADWAKESINEAVEEFMSLNKPRFRSDKGVQHLYAACAAARSTHANLVKQEQEAGMGAAHRNKVKRHKRTRAQIRAANAGGSKSDNKKKGGKK